MPLIYSSSRTHRYFPEEERAYETEEDTSDDDNDDDNDTITGIQSSRVHQIHRLVTRTNSEILEDLSAIIRILRQIHVLYRIFHHSRDQVNDERTHNEEEEEASLLLEAGLADLQSVLSTQEKEHKRQSTLALLALITYQHVHCSEHYLSRYLDPDGNYHPTLALVAAATYDDDEGDCTPKSCRDIIMAAEELCGPDWLKEFDQNEENGLRNMLEKLTLIAKVRLKIRANEE
ncbi:hypothetical protein A0J61_08794 [Choanephora cucurbitarum]|uniref:Uncharacterized protein n=1 Tax=Choanephora cucurbitarum TaxID=101091 RepID=A0A1C7N3D3_9FUNG|nr:hypothetical protein A0J61_08794 [Choanephora cucurbitarum]